MGAARTKAQKLKAKRGRPKKDGPRTPSGQLSRSKDANLEMNMLPAIERRVRHYGIRNTKDASAFQLAGDPHWGYLLGRLMKDGVITRAQHDAGNRYADDMANWLGLSGTPFPSAKAQNLFAVRGHKEDETERLAEKAKRAKAHIEQLHKAITTDEMESFHKSMTYKSMQVKRGIATTVYSVCVLDNDHLRDLNSLMKSWLNTGLNRLVRFYQLE